MKTEHFEWVCVIYTRSFLFIYIFVLTRCPAVRFRWSYQLISFGTIRIFARIAVTHGDYVVVTSYLRLFDGDPVVSSLC